MPYMAIDGKVYIAPRQGSGDPGAFRYLGKTSGFSFGLEPSVVERKETETGQRFTALRSIDEKKASMSLKLEEFSKENVALALWGAAAVIAAGTVTAEVLPTGLVANDYARLKKQKVSSVVVKDSAGSPATLTAGTHYNVTNADLGMIQFINVGSFVQPFKVNYANAAVDNVPMFGVVPGKWWIRLEGVNRQDANKPVLVELYNCDLDPLKDFATKGDISEMDLSGAPLYDETKASDTTLGQFGRIVMLP